jgi:drug/metabolite transporter (DMT)-like permease
MRNKTAAELSGRCSHPGCNSNHGLLADYTKGILFVVLAAIGFSAKSIFVKLAYVQQVDALTLLTLRMGISLPLVMLIWFFKDKRKERLKLRVNDGFAVFVLSLLGYYLANVLDFWGLQFISAGLERLIVFLCPTLVAIFSCIVFGRGLKKMEVVALATCYAGVALILYRQIDVSHPAILWGSALVFGSAVVYAVYLIGSYRLIARLGPYRFTALGMAVASMACLVQFALTHPLSALDVSNEVYIISACMALFSTVIPSLFLSFGMQRIGPSQAALISSIGPVSTLLLADLVLGESMSSNEELLGSGLVLVGVVFTSLKRHQVVSIKF